jgi:4-hydroxyacetophenone monooxygenase
LRSTTPEPDGDPTDQLSAAVAVANIPTLLMVLVQLTGDLGWLDEPYRLSRTKGMSDNDTGGLPDDLQAGIRAAALDAIREWRAGKPMAIPEPPNDLIVRMLGASMGESIPMEYGPMLAEELRVGQPRRTVPLTPPPDGFRALIIGAGLSGLCAAIGLGELGIPFTILERNADLGGTWLENRYPGAAVDTPSHLYQFSFEPYDWSRYFASQAEVLGYLRHIAANYGLLPHIRFETTVVRAGYDEAAQAWNLQVQDAAGQAETLTADIVISAVGAFNPPKIPPIPGLDRFEGPCFHSARWPEGLDLAGQRIAVVGNGATAMQIVPAVADEAASITIFQRSPQWAQPFPKFLQPVPDAIRSLSAEVPLYYAWQRLRLAWIFHDKLHGSLQKDPAWAHPDRSINAANDEHRRYFTDYIQAELGDRDDLLPKALPTYPPFGKRMLMDNGWFRTLTRDHVHLVTESISEVTAHHVITSSGAKHEVDIIVLATGFDVVRFLSSFEVVGRSGRTLRETWNDDDGRAFLGLAVPDFPNFFCLYGPNTQPGHGGSLIYTVERQVNYLVSLLTQMFEHDLGVAECRADVYEEYNRRVDEAHARMIWTHPGMDTYYRNDRGRVVMNMPFRNLDFWRMTARASLDDFSTETRRHGSPRASGLVHA